MSFPSMMTIPQIKRHMKRVHSWMIATFPDSRRPGLKYERSDLMHHPYVFHRYHIDVRGK